VVDKNYKDVAVYFKNKIQVERFLEYMQERTDIRWRSGRKPSEIDVERIMYSRARETEFAILIKKEYGELCMEYADRNCYSRMEKDYNINLLNLEMFLPRYQSIVRF
jgi:hypothetical protein